MNDDQIHNDTHKHLFWIWLHLPSTHAGRPTHCRPRFYRCSRPEAAGGEPRAPRFRSRRSSCLWRHLAFGKARRGGNLVVGVQSRHLQMCYTQRVISGFYRTNDSEGGWMVKSMAWLVAVLKRTKPLRFS